MAITQRILNMDEYFRITPGDKILINDLNFLSIDDVETINNSLMTVYNNTDVISTKPSCDCGKTSGRYVLNKTCPECGTECRDIYSKVYPILWLKSLTPNLKFCNVIFWLMLSKNLDAKIDYLRWLSDDKYNPPVKIPSYIFSIKELIGGERSYSNTMNNIPKIIMFLQSLTKFKDPEKQTMLQYMLDLYENSKNDIFTEYLPIVNKKLFVMENTFKGKFINLTASNAIEVVMRWLKVCSMDMPKPKDQEIATARAISGLATLYGKYYDEHVAKKAGLIRKHVYGGRSHFTFRNVIISRSGRHRHDQIEAPWCIGPTVFRPHLLNKLIKRGYSYKDASNLLYRAVKKYEPVIDECLEELVKESNDPRGIGVIIQRNPSLKIGSANRVYIEKFGKDPNEKIISFSQLTVRLGNGDYDGSIRCDNVETPKYKFSLISQEPTSN